MGGTWYYGDAFYCYTIDTATPFRHGMLLEKRMKFPHEDIKLFSVIHSAYDRDDLDYKETEDNAMLLFGFRVLDMDPERFMELKQILETYMAEAIFKGKEKFSEKPTFQASVGDADYGDYHHDSNELEDEDDKEEYKNMLRRSPLKHCWDDDDEGEEEE
jgi:hypothetical protein